MSLKDFNFSMFDKSQGVCFGESSFDVFGTESRAYGRCGSSLSCSGGGGQCGSSLHCSGGGGRCGSSLNCSGN